MRNIYAEVGKTCWPLVYSSLKHPEAVLLHFYAANFYEVSDLLPKCEQSRQHLPYIPTYNAHFFNQILTSKLGMHIICGYICYMSVCWKIPHLWFKSWGCIICGCALYVGVHGNYGTLSVSDPMSPSPRSPIRVRSVISFCRLWLAATCRSLRSCRP